MSLRKVLNICGVVLVLFGVVLFISPMAINEYNSVETEKMIEVFNNDIETEKNNDENELLNKLKADVYKYNLNLAENGQDIQDPFFYKGESVDLTQYGIENNMFGYIDIPVMNVKLGIFLGAANENMNKGAVHLDKTSLPIGGINTNCVIAAHRGNGRYGDMFRNIQKLSIGDSVYITNPWERLEYRVTDIFAAEPEDIDKIIIQKGRDIVTLVTCHPYGSSEFRYIVYCERAGD